MAIFEIKNPNIPLWSGANGSLVLDMNADPRQPTNVGASPILDASFNVDGNADICFAHTGSVAIGIQAGSHDRIVPIFQEDVGGGVDLVRRFSLTDFLKPNNLPLAFEVGGNTNLTAEGAFSYSILSATATLNAGVDATYLTIRSFPRTETLQPMLLNLMGSLILPANVTRPPAPGDLVSLESGGQLNFKVGATAGYEINGTNSFKVSDLFLSEHYAFLSEHYALSVIGKLSFTGQLAGRFSVDVTAGSTTGFARIVVRRRRQEELQVAADVNVKADLKSFGDALNSFDGFDMGENSVFAVFDGLVLVATSVATSAAEARSSSLTFKSSKDDPNARRFSSYWLNEIPRALNSAEILC
jgi:hypothetical protein